MSQTQTFEKTREKDESERLADFSGRIRIIKVPEGEAPLAVRQAWVGLVLPCSPICGYNTDKDERGVLTQKSVKKRRTFSVPQDKAIDIIADHDPRIFVWWLDHGFPIERECFGFAEDEAEIIEGVTHQVLVEMSDTGDGDPER